MAHIDLTGDYEFSVTRTDDEPGEIIVILTAGSDTATFTAGHSLSDAEDLVAELRDLTTGAEQIVADWQDRPDIDTDGSVSAGPDGYYVQLSGKPEGPYPSCAIATYELARQMAASGSFPHAWDPDEQGNAEPIHDAIAARLDEHRKLTPLPGARYQPGDVMALAGDLWPSWVVVHDYGDLGAMLHAQSDPSMTAFAEHDRLTPYDEVDDEEPG
jgi:hypothetical protein